MRKLKKWQLLILLLISAVIFNACSSTPAENSQISSINDVQQKTEKSETKTSEAVTSAVKAELDKAKKADKAVENSQKSSIKDVQQKTENSETKTSESVTTTVKAELDKAQKAGKAVFVVVTGTGTTDTDKATTIAKGANAIYKNAVIVQMNRDDVANASLVAEWRLAGAPLPLILVISSKGIPTGGYTLKQATAENIAALVPSPKLEKVYEAIGKGKHAIVVFTKKSFTDKTDVLEEANKAVSQLNNKAVLIEVDMDDERENGFMQKVRVSPIMAKGSVTLVINNKGQVAGTSTTVPDAAKLVAAAKTPVKSGCGPGCGPSGCGK